MFQKNFKTNISLGSVATCFKCDGIFNCHFIANLLLILEVQKSIAEIWTKVCVGVFYLNTVYSRPIFVLVLKMMSHIVGY